MRVEAERFSTERFTPPWVRHEHHERYRFAASYVQNKVVVDCACGSGEGTRIFAQAGARSVFAVDISEDAVHETRARCQQWPHVSIRQSDGLALPLGDESAEVFISLETFEHVPDQHGFLAEARRVLRPGGLFICSTPNRRVYNPGHSLDSRPWNRFHVREYDTGQFEQALRVVFGSVELYGQNPSNPKLVQLFGKLAHWLPGHSVVRIQQALKLRRLVRNRAGDHIVIPNAGQIFEYDVAVCRKA